MRREIDWARVEEVRQGLMAGLDADAMAGNLVATAPRHAATLASLTAEELVQLAQLGKTFPQQLGVAAFHLGRQRDHRASLRCYDALAEIASKAPLGAANGALRAVRASVHGLGPMPERARRYLERFGARAPENTALYLNMAYLHAELGEPERAVGALREGILAGDPSIDLGSIAFLRGTPALAALASLTPIYPRALRAFQILHSVVRDPVVAGAGLDLDVVSGTLGTGARGRYALLPEADATFPVFARLPDGGEVAFWRREPGAPLASQPVVIFGAGGSLMVYAQHLQGFFALLGHGLALLTMERLGARLDERPWAPPARIEKLSPRSQLLQTIRSFAREALALEPDEERRAAFLLVPPFRAAVDALRA